MLDDETQPRREAPAQPEGSCADAPADQGQVIAADGEAAACAQQGGEEGPARYGWLRGIAEFLIAFVILIGVIQLVKMYVMEPFEIPSRSMVPTIVPDDMLYAEKLSLYGDKTPTVGQVYTFTKPNDDSGETLIKRVIAIGGQTIDLRDGDVYVDDVKLDEPYVHGQKTYAMNSTAGVTYPYTIPEGHFWVMGDNRGNSGDSRVFGAVPYENITGHAVFRYWPIFRVQETETVDLGGFELTVHPIKLNIGPLDYTA